MTIMMLGEGSFTPSSLLTLGRVDASIILLSLTRSLLDISVDMKLARTIFIKVLGHPAWQAKGDDRCHPLQTAFVAGASTCL